MIFGLDKAGRLYQRRLLRLAVPLNEQRLNPRETHEFDLPGSQQFNPEFFNGFLVDPPEQEDPA